MDTAQISFRPVIIPASDIKSEPDRLFHIYKENKMNALSVVLLGLGTVVVIVFLYSIKIVPQRSAYIVERLGK